jgi:hypothetical protein
MTTNPPVRGVPYKLACQRENMVQVALILRGNFLGHLELLFVESRLRVEVPGRDSTFDTDLSLGFLLL